MFMLISKAVSTRFVFNLPSSPDQVFSLPQRNLKTIVSCAVGVKNNASAPVQTVSFVIAGMMSSEMSLDIITCTQV